MVKRTAALFPSALFSVLLSLLALSCQNALLDKVKATQKEAVSPKIEVYSGDALAASGAVVEFVDAAIGRSAELELVIRNQGAAALSLGSLEISGGDGRFVIAHAPDASVPVGGETSLVLSFTPRDDELRTATLSLRTNDVRCATFSLELRGDGELAVPYVATAATVETLDSTRATGSGNLLSDGGGDITAYGICWASTPNPTKEGEHVEVPGSVSGPFSLTLTGLVAAQDYHLRAYATNGKGTGYGEDVAFTAGLCLVQFDSAGGSAVPDQEVSLGDHAAEPDPEPTQAGYTLSGWYADPGFAGEAWDFAEDEVTGNLTLHAKWTGIEYAITFHIDNGLEAGSPTRAQALACGDTASLTTLAAMGGFTYLGCSFYGWSPSRYDHDYDSATDYLDGADFTMGPGNVDLYAIWATQAEGLTFNDLGGSYSVSGASVIVDEVVIPGCWNGEPVSAIAAEGFKGRSTIVTLTMPATVTAIGASAFSGCGALGADEGVLIPNTVTSIGEAAFESCASMVSLTFPANATFNAIPKNCCKSCTTLSTVSIPDTVTSLGESAFFGCGGLNSISLPDGLLSIGVSAFRGSGLLSVTIPNTVTGIEGSAFAYCNGLAEVLFEAPSSVATLGFDCFRGSGLTSISIPESVATIGESAFAMCDSLGSVSGMAGVTTIAGVVFAYTAIESIDIPASVQTIGGNSFQNCASLETVTGMAGVQTMGERMFLNCAALKEAEIGGMISTIPSYTFSGCSSLESVTVAPDIAAIGTSAFDGCAALLTLDLGYNLSSIGDNAFANCGLTDLCIENPTPASLGITALGDVSKEMTVHVCDEDAVAAYSSAWGGSYANFEFTIEPL